MNIKRWLNRLKHSNLKYLIAPFYVSWVSAELWAESLLTRLVCRPCKDPLIDNLTAVVKTFERPHKIKRLLRSLQRQFPTLTIIVVEDSRNPTRLPDTVNHIVLPFDQGVCAGKNAGLEQVNTPFVLLLDDDFICYRKTKLLSMLQRLIAEPRIDLLAGILVCFPLRRKNTCLNHPFLYPNSAKPLIPINTPLAGGMVALKTPNFFIARTDKVRDIGWDENIKRLDHADFFTRAIGKLVCVTDLRCAVLHDQTFFKQRYLKHRFDFDQDRKYLYKRYTQRS